MTMTRPRAAHVKCVFHNSETGVFEASVVLEEGGVHHAYEVAVPAPITTEFDALRPALIAAAEAQHARGNCDLTSRRTASPQPDRTEDMLDRILAAHPNYLEEILRRAA